MNILILVVVLVVLVVVHELGHFVVAKLSGMRVDEFGIGYPPKLWSFKKGETEYSVNALPFGGFVRIYGEDSEQGVGDRGQGVGRAFNEKPRILQALVLLAGITMNLVTAFVIFTFILAIGTPRVLDPSEVSRASDAKLAVAEVMPLSPAALAGLKAGDYITGASYGDTTYTGVTPDSFTAFVTADTAKEPIQTEIDRDGKIITLTMTPAAGVIVKDPDRVAVGLGVATVGTVPLSFGAAIVQGAQTTWYVTHDTAIGLWHFLSSIFMFTADFSQVSGPIGIAGVVGTASSEGFTSLLSLVAVISVNLALINIIPVPALDGGRLLFVIIEAVIRRPIKRGVAQAVNTAGFGLLVLLMLAVTAHDIYRIFT